MLKSFTEYEYQVAQEYEFKSAARWMDENIPGILNAMRDVGTREICNVGPGNPNILKEFFCNDSDMWDEFCDRVRAKDCLEIASGPCGAIATWNWMKVGRRFIVDPLILHYQEYQEKKFGKSVFDGVHLCQVEVEKSWPEDNPKNYQFDGFIFARNSLDHCRDPHAAIKRIGELAEPGCLLFFWAEIKHENADAGHRDICETPEECRKLFEAEGFRFIRPVTVENIKGPQFGGVFEKQ